METRKKVVTYTGQEKKHPVPLLVVGLGGAGCDALLTVREAFAECFISSEDTRGRDLPVPDSTAFLCIDSEPRRPDKLGETEYVSICIPDLNMMLADRSRLLTEYERTWMENYPAPCVYANRQAARLSLSRNYDRVAGAVKGALHSILSRKTDGEGCPDRQLEIAVISGIGGNTGSGILLDICQILRFCAAMEEVASVRLTGYIMMPDVDIARVGAGARDHIRSNAYAALKELDFWMRVREHGAPYTMQYGNGAAIAWDKPPLDTCILMSSSNVNGLPYKDGYMAVRHTIAESLIHDFAKEESIGRRDDYYHCHYKDMMAMVRPRKNYPLFYGYCAIGAFTKRIPKKQVLYYEGSLLFRTFIPLRDDSGKLQPDRRMFTDGQGKLRAEKITGIGKQLMQDFRTNSCKLPAFFFAGPVGPATDAPHCRWRDWRDRVSSPAALNAAEQYLENAWGRFGEFAGRVITDPEQGPFALETYLDAPDGLLSFMSEIRESWTKQYHKTHNQSIAQAEEMCFESWPSFRNPPIIGKKKALEQYDHAIKTLYTYVNNDQFLEKHVDALNRLILRIQEYLRDGLQPMCDAILMLEQDFNTAEQVDATVVQDIYDLSAVKQSIDDRFAEENAEDRLSSKFLAKVTEITMETQPNVDAKTSGVEFVCRRVGLQKVCGFIQQELDRAYGDINGQSFDDIMRANVGDEVAAQQKWMATLANSALDSAFPMFMQDSAYAAEPKTPYCCMLIPRDAQEHLKYIRTAFENHDPVVEPKAGSRRDRISTLTVWGNLPLYRYGMFESLRAEYDRQVNSQSGHGLHLVRNGDPDADYLSDWSRLPSPKPYFLFSDEGVRSEREQYEMIKTLVAKGIACGMLEVHDGREYASATLRIFRESDGGLMTGEAMLAGVQVIAAEKDPVTGAPYSGVETADRLYRYLQSGEQVLLEENEIRLFWMAGAPGLEREPCDPLDSRVQTDPTVFRKAKENHRRLCVLMTEAMIYTRPDLVQGLQLQAEAYSEIYRMIQERTGMRGEA